MIYDVPNGVRSGVTVCVGRALGAELPSLASLAIRNGRLLLGCWLPLPLFAVCAFTSGWARIFTRDEAVILQLHALVPWLVVNSCAGGLMAIANAVMAGCARPKSPSSTPGQHARKLRHRKPLAPQAKDCRQAGAALLHLHWLPSGAAPRLQLWARRAGICGRASCRSGGACTHTGARGGRCKSEQ